MSVATNLRRHKVKTNYSIRKIFAAKKSFPRIIIHKIHRLEQPCAVRPPRQVFFVCCRHTLALEVSVRLNKRQYLQLFQSAQPIQVLFGSGIESYKHITIHLIRLYIFRHLSQFIRQVYLRQIPRDMDRFQQRQLVQPIRLFLVHNPHINAM